MLLPDPIVVPAANATFEERTPFHLGTEEPIDAPAEITGALPEWLRGALVRTCPAVFHTRDWHADHWFDGLGMLYAFRVAGPGAVRYQQRLLASQTVARYREGKYKPAGFGTPLVRSWLRRIFEPVPEITDNANVNIVPMGDELVAMTESPRQLAVDPATLQVKGEVAYRDDLGEIIMSAHPHLDVARGQVVNVGSRYGAKSAVLIYEHGLGERSRRLVGEWRSPRLPYVHSFGLTAKRAVIIGHPLTVSPLSLLWSNRGFVDHFQWRPSEGTRLLVMDRGSGAVNEHLTDAMFVFHVIHAFDDGDDVVLDVVAYDDASVVDQLRRSALSARMPDVAPKPIRLRIGARGVIREPLGDVGFEFPVVHYKRVSGKEHHVVWGTSLHGEGKRWRSTIVRLDMHTRKTEAFSEPGWVFGEPIFVAEPSADEEGQGVLVVVGAHQDQQKSAMVVLDAETLAAKAWATVPTAIPLGFHGSFVRG
ncbi:15,15' beta carotene dioxygenase [Minicystis rosea]|nr:15,15' beta carotene dioxygenase [Minicystis rosea]